jgi:Asp/Glu/hydantoin racemase
MRLLLLNANTTEAMTDRMVAMARAIAPAGVEVTGATGRFGARYISSRAASAIAAHAALDAYAAFGRDADAVLIGCFGEPGLDALREVAPVPVLGLADACGAAACRIARRFGVVTGGAAWKPMLTEFYAARGLADRLAGVRTVAPTGAEIAADPDAAIALLAASCRASAAEDGAEAVILGGAGLAGLASRVAAAAGVPVLCSVETGIREAFAVLGLRRDARPDKVETIGLSAELSQLFS